ncbi:hypothetical protein CL634_07880 [bacterium]|nr:hypothetical protein [bacterium]|tara:strand:- start:375 stop:554 length:180 start_codon:yes stop_codon:yes gene_type:complete
MSIATMRQAIRLERRLEDCYREMMSDAKDEKTKAVLHDMLVMEEMNELLLRSLSQHLGV